MEGRMGARQQPTLHTHAEKLSVEEEDLELTSAPGAGGVEMHND
jgi:hypothetical protein